jgi:hypothetical protein
MEDGPSSRELREAQEAAVAYNRRAHALVHGILRSYFAARERRPAPSTMTFVVLDSSGVVISRRSVSREELSRSSGLSIDTEEATMRRFLPDIPAGARSSASGISDGPIVGLDESATVIWWQLEAVKDPSDVALQEAITAVFANRGGEPPADTAVGIVVAFDASWKTLDARRVTIAEVLATNSSSLDTRERLLPVMRGLESQGEAMYAGGGRFGLARGSVLRYWRAYEPGSEEAARAKAVRIALDTVRTYVRAHGLRDSVAISIRVLISPDWKVIGVAHLPTVADAPMSSLDSLAASFPSMSGRRVLRHGFANPRLIMTSPDARVRWVQLAPP